jgi:hypothetical protein
MVSANRPENVTNFVTGQALLSVNAPSSVKAP